MGGRDERCIHPSRLDNHSLGRSFDISHSRIIGLIELLKHPILKEYLFIFGGVMLIGLVVPLELMAIYYKIKN